MTESSKRPKNTSLMSLILSIVFFCICFLLGRWSDLLAVYAVSWLLLSAVLIWFVLAVQFHMRSLAEQEKLDMSQLTRTEEGPAIFKGIDEHSTLFAAAQRRLKILERWFIPIFSALIAAYQAGIGVYLLKVVSSGKETEPREALLCAVCMIGIAFVSFLISRYATGMSGQPNWRPLRAGGSSFLGVAVLCFALAIGLALAHFNWFGVVNIINWIIPILLVVLGAETALNVVLDIYRPRLKDQYARSAFDSRLLGIINEPGGILRSAAETIDYQFGFKVSQTWFYKLLEKAITPLVLFSAATLYLLSCIVVVNPDERAIIEYFGNPMDKTGEVRLVGPGLTFKRPWPIDIAYKHPIKKVMEVHIGYVPQRDPKTGEIIPEPSLLWGKSHYKEEYHLLVASEEAGTGSDAGAVPVSLVVAAVPVQYRIKDLYSFIYNNSKPKQLLESICYRELTKFAASASIEVDNEATLEQSLLGAGRAQAKQILTGKIQDAADEMGLGVEIVFLGLQGVHPPPEVAADYQKVIGAVQEEQAIVLRSLAERNKTLSTLVGSVEDADRLYGLAAKYQQAKEENNIDQIDELSDALDNAFLEAKGDIFSTLREARSYAFEKATLARATGERFESQIKAYEAAKEIYKREQRLTVFEEALQNIRKYIVVADPNDTQIFIFDAKEKITPSLYDIGAIEETSRQ